MCFLKSSDINRAVNSQKMARDWKFWNKKVKKLHYPCLENNGTISFAVTTKVMCAFVFAYAKCWFSHDVAHLRFRF